MIDKINALLEFFEEKDGGYRESGQLYYEVNVKRSNDYIDTDELIEKRPVKYQKRLKEQFTDELQQDIYIHWLQYETEYLITDAIQGRCTNMDRSNWMKYAGDAILQKKKSLYPALDELKTQDEKLEMLEEWILKDEKELRIFSGVGEIYQAGRMGGHIIFSYSDNSDELAEVLQDIEENGEKTAIFSSLEDRNAIIQEAEETQADILYLKNYIDRFNTGLEWKYELNEKMDEYQYELREEDAEARRVTINAKNKTEGMDTTLSELLLSQDGGIKRLAKGIYSKIEKR